MSTVCLDEAAVLAFLDGTLPDAVRGDVEAHVASCSICSDVVTWAAADLATASRAPGREGQPFLGQLAPGARVDRYQILGPVGRGGMGEVYAAYHPDLDRRIALKIVYESGVTSVERRARLLREARTVARLSHPNVIAVYDAGTVGERVYIAMEFVDGDTLDVWLRAIPRSWPEILDVFVATGRGLAAAHAAGIVHRDFKPQNVMIGKDGSVRVMDFGLARLVREDLDTGAFAREAREALAESGERGPTGTIGTKTGTLLGTPAYMAPEQWRGEPTDARADQFSFCVALYEALYGVRPVLAHLGENAAAANLKEAGVPPGTDTRPGSVAPAWLRGIVLRGLAPERQKRFDSMDRLLAALTRGRTRGQRRFAGLAVGIAVSLLGIGAWRLSAARRFDCKPPADRLAAAWAPNDPSDKRHQSIRAAVLATGHPEAASIWQQISSALDTYVGRWSAMYKETCEATHLRGEQSEEVLDLRMRCLNENLEDVRALTDVLATSERAALPGAVTAVSGLTPVARCADLRVLRSAAPLPRDERTLQTVQTLRHSLTDVRALFDVGRYRDALDHATTLRPAVEATGYRPLLAELLEATGSAEIASGLAGSEKLLRKSLVMAVAEGEDEVAATAAVNLIYVTGHEGRYEESNGWWALANAFLDRLGKGHGRLRAWVMQNRGEVLIRMGDYAQARDLFQSAVALKEETLGHDHPDVALSLISLANALHALGREREALEAFERVGMILPRNSDLLDLLCLDRSDVLIELRRYAEADSSLERVMKDWQTGHDELNWRLGYPLTALGEVRLATGDSAAAVSYLERALHIREASESDPTMVAETRFGLARALWESGGAHSHSLSLARSARETYATNNRPRQLSIVDAWLTAHASKTHDDHGQVNGCKLALRPSASPVKTTR